MKLIDSMKIGSIFKTRIRVHYTWILVFILVPWAMSTQFSTGLSFSTRIILGVITAFLFYCAVFLREIVLLIIANRNNVKVKTVTIFAFGGLLQTNYETDSPSKEMLLAVSGMLCNLAVTLVFYFSSLFFDNTESIILDVPLKWLAFFYLTLSLFHIFPAYPLEGGRMLHVLFWKVSGNYRRSMRISGTSGWILGLLVMAGAIALVVLTDERFTGMFFIGLGLIIQNAATHSLRQLKQLPWPLAEFEVTGEVIDSSISPVSDEITTDQPTR